MVAKDNNKTKKHINSDIKSAKVANHKGAPAGGHFGHSSAMTSTPHLRPHVFSLKYMNLIKLLIL